MTSFITSSFFPLPFKYVFLNVLVTEDCKVAAIGDNLGEIDENFYSSLNEINETDIHLKCLVREHLELQKYGNTTDYCPTSTDSILCWPRTYKGVLAILPCLDEFQGIQYDINRKQFLNCHGFPAFTVFNLFISIVFLHIWNVFYG